MCQDDLGPRTLITPFEDCALDELTRGNPDAPASRAARIYANRVARLAIALNDLLDELDGAELPPGAEQLAAQARDVLIQESVAAGRGEEVV
jgi:hypothetical protein